MPIGDVDPTPAQDPTPSPESQAPTPVELTDDSLVKLPGQDEPITWRDYQARQSQAEADFARRREQATQLLQQRARELDQRSGQPQPQPQSQPTDPIAALRNRAVVDGNTLAQLYERVQNEGFAPLQQWGQAINHLIQQISGRTQQLESRLSPFEQSRQDEQRTGVINEALGRAGVPLQNPALTNDISVLRELGTNIFYGWHPNRGDFQSDRDYDAAVNEFQREYPRLVTEQIEGLRRVFRALDRLDAEEARRRLIPSQAGGAAPTGDRPYQFETPRQLARRAAAAGIFDSSPTT